MKRTGSTGHDVGIDVDRIDRVRYGDADVRREQLLKVAAVALTSVAHEHVVGVDRHAQRRVVAGDDRLA